VTLKPGWCIEAGQRAGERDRASGYRLKAQKPEPEDDRSKRRRDSRGRYDRYMGDRVDALGGRWVWGPANQWLHDARKQAATAADAFAGLFGKDDE
jgi:hypothetical protein